MKFTVEQINKAFDSIPVATRKAMSVVSVDKVMQELAATHQVSLDKISQISGQITFVLIGLEKAGDFYDSIKSQTGLSDEVLIKLVDEINKKIFIPFRQAMIAFSYEPEEEVAENEPEAPSNPSIKLNFPGTPKTQEQNDRAILRSTDIELDEDPGEQVREALEDVSARSLDRDKLLRTLENPPKSEGLIKTPEVVRPSISGVGTSFNRESIKVPTNIVPPPVNILDKTNTPSHQENDISPIQKLAQSAGVVGTPEVSGTGIVGSKLQATFKIPKEVSNYTVPAIGEKKIQSDPYREPV